MDPTAWAAKLLVTAALLGGYPAPQQVPHVAFAPAAALAARFCGGTCVVHGAFLPSEGVWLDAGLDLDNSPRDRSVVVHEMTHYLQALHHRFDLDGPCDRWKDRELEAYAVQDRYLARYDLGIGDAVQRAMQILPAGCTMEADTPDPETAHLSSEPMR